MSARAGKVVLGVDPAARFKTGGVVKTGGGEKRGGGMRSTVVEGTATVSNEFIFCCAVPKHEGSQKELFFKKRYISIYPCVDLYFAHPKESNPTFPSSSYIVMQLMSEEGSLSPSTFTRKGTSPPSEKLAS